MKLLDKLLNGNGLDKDLESAYTAFSKSALASGLIGDFEKKLEEVIKEPSKSLTEDQKKAIDQLLAGMNMDCVFGYEPINFNTGNFFMDQEDVSMDELGGKFKISRCYNSKTASYDSIFGRGWEFKYTERVRDLAVIKY